MTAPDDMLKLTACPFCKRAMMFRKALHISDGNVDSIIHASPADCGMVVFEDGSTDESIIAKWNTRASAQRPTGGEVVKTLEALSFWCTEERRKIRGGQGGFDEQSEREIGIGIVEAEIDRRAATASPPSETGHGQSEVQMERAHHDGPIISSFQDASTLG